MLAKFQKKKIFITQKYSFTLQFEDIQLVRHECDCGMGIPCQIDRFMPARVEARMWVRYTGLLHVYIIVSRSFYSCWHESESLAWNFYTTFTFGLVLIGRAKRTDTRTHTQLKQIKYNKRKSFLAFKYIVNKDIFREIVHIYRSINISRSIIISFILLTLPTFNIYLETVPLNFVLVYKYVSPDQQNILV